MQQDLTRPAGSRLIPWDKNSRPDGLVNWLDRAISWFSPQTGLARQRARLATQALLSYEGAMVGRRTSGWIAGGSSANAEIGQSLHLLRNRSRQLCRDNPYAARAIDETTTQTVGTGIVATTKSGTERERQKVDEAWRIWMDECDADGQLDFYGLQDLAVNTIFESGEVLIRRRLRFSDDGLAIPMQIQVVEPDYLDLNKTERLPNGSGYIIQGVEFDQIGRRVAYWLFAEHPGDVISTSKSGTLISRRVPASEVLHVYRKRRQQVRGVPLLHPVLLTLHDLDGYLDADRMRKRIEACLALFISSPEGPDINNPLGNSTIDPASGKRITEFKPGMIEYGTPGQKAEFFEPTATAGFAEHVKQNERIIATGIGLTYERLTGDLSNVNFSSFKAGELSFRANIERFRWLTLIPMMLKPVRAWFEVAALAAGKIPSFPGPIITEWTPPVFGSVQPLEDAQAAELNLRLGRQTWPQAVRELGYDENSQIKEIEQWKERLEAAGVKFEKGAKDDSNKDGAETQQEPARSKAA